MDWNCVRLKLMKRKEDSIKRKKIEGRSKQTNCVRGANICLSKMEDTNM